MGARPSVPWTHLHCTFYEVAERVSTRRVRIGVVGLGYWGPNIARNFSSLEGCELTWCCD